MFGNADWKASPSLSPQIAMRRGQAKAPQVQVKLHFFAALGLLALAPLYSERVASSVWLDTDLNKKPAPNSLSYGECSAVFCTGPAFVWCHLVPLHVFDLNLPDVGLVAA